MVYYDLNLKFDIDNKAIKGYNDIHFKVLKEHQTMQIDLFKNMNVDKIEMQGKELPYTRIYNAVIIDLTDAPTLSVGEVTSLRFYYSGKPIIARRPPWDGGFVYKKDANNNDWIGVACQGIGASLWWPNKDHQSEEPDSMRITGTVPAHLMFVSNGNLVNTTNENDEFTTYSWLVTYPINNYTVSINIGDYKHFGEQYISNSRQDTLACDYYVLANNMDKAKKHFEQVKPMLSCYEQYMGPYPFWNDGFALIETPYLGMEHQSGIAYGNDYLTGYAGSDYSGIGLDFDYIIIHEAGHEWWGNNITTADIADMWVHEGFCTYAEALYVECMYDYEKAMDYVNAKKNWVANEAPIIGQYGVNKEGSGDMYRKGMLILNTLRHIIGDDEVWFDIVLGLNTDFRHSIVTHDEVVNYINQKTGKNFVPFFDQYMRHANLPVLEYSLQKKGRKLLVKYRWDADVKDFSMPVQFTDKKGKFHTLNAGSTWQTSTYKKVKPKDFKLAERMYYFKAKEIE